VINYELYRIRTSHLPAIFVDIPIDYSVVYFDGGIFWWFTFFIFIYLLLIFYYDQRVLLPYLYHINNVPHL
jgi:hypothetical protein